MAAKIDIPSLLAQSHLFAKLDDAGRQAVAAEMREVSFPSGQVIFSRGDAGSELYLVTAGRVRLSILTSEGRELSFAHAEPPMIFGEIAMFDGGKRTADATAVAKVQALSLSKAAFSRLLSQRPEIAEAAIQLLARRVREADDQLEAIALYPIEARLARFFLAAARQKDPSGKSEFVTIELPISQGELALLVGASRPKVNAALVLLESDGSIERKGQTLVCDIEALTAIAGV